MMRSTASPIAAIAAVAVGPVDADAVVVGDKALVQADVVLIERRNEELRLDRRAGYRAKLDLGIQAPDVIGFVFGYGNIKEVDLVAGDEYAKADQHGDQDLQVQIY